MVNKNSPQPFLNREAELKRLQSLLNQNKNVLLHGPAGIGKSSLLREFRRRISPDDRVPLSTSGMLTPAPWLRQLFLSLTSSFQIPNVHLRLGLRQSSRSAEAIGVLACKSPGFLRTVLLDTLKEGRYVLILDPLSCIPRAFYELLFDLERLTKMPLVFSARSAHMEHIGNASRFSWPRDQQIALGPLPNKAAEFLFDSSVSDWNRQPANMEEFRKHVLKYADGNPGTLLGLLQLASHSRYWSGDTVKTHVLTVDFNIGSFQKTGCEPLADEVELEQ